MTTLVEDVKEVITQEQLSFQEVLDRNLIQMIEGYEVYLSGLDGRIYYEGREEGIPVNDMALSMNTLYIHAIEFGDGNGYFVVKSGIEGRGMRNSRLYSLLISNLVFLILAFLLIRRQLRKFSIEPVQMPQELEITSLQNSDPAEATAHPGPDKVYTDMYVVLQQFVGELDFETELRGQEGPVYIAGDIEKFVQVLIYLARKIEAVIDDSRKLILEIGADEQMAELNFLLHTKQDGEIFSAEDYRYVRERMIPIQGNLKTRDEEGMVGIKLSFARQ